MSKSFIPFFAVLLLMGTCSYNLGRSGRKTEVRVDQKVLEPYWIKTEDLNSDGIPDITLSYHRHSDIILYSHKGEFGRFEYTTFR